MNIHLILAENYHLTLTIIIQACSIEIITFIQQQSEFTVSKINNHQFSFHLIHQYWFSHTFSFDYQIDFSFYFNVFDQFYLKSCYILEKATESLSYLLEEAERLLKTWLKDALFENVFDSLVKLQTTLFIWMQCFKSLTHFMIWFWLFWSSFHVYILSSSTSCNLVFCSYKDLQLHHLICNQHLWYHLCLLHDDHEEKRKKESLKRSEWV